MVSETIPVKGKDKDLSTFGGRLAAERERLRLKQVDMCIRLSVSKTTQIKYEASERKPDLEYLAELDNLGFDVLYILTGVRSTEALSAEHQNLIEAYEDAPDLLRQAAFAVLTSPYISTIEQARKIPGYYRHELKGEQDIRFNPPDGKPSED